jgi:hypothetical protein
MSLASKLAAKAAAASAAAPAASAAASSATRPATRPATTAIRGSSDARSSLHVAGEGGAARADSPSTSRSSRPVAGGRGAVRADSPSTSRSSHRAEHRGAAPSTTRSSRRTEHRVATHSGDFVSRDVFDKLARKFEALESTTTETGSRLAQVEEDVRATKGDTKQILALLTKKKKEQEMLPAPAKRKTIMPLPTVVLTESDSDEDDGIEYVPYGKGDQERLSAVPIWGKKKTSTPVACKSGSAAVSSSSSSSSKDLSRAAGDGAMVVASKSKQPLPLPETLGRSGKERSSSPRAEKLCGTGLIECTDLKALVALMEGHGYTQVPVIVRKTRDVSVHFETAIANAYDLGKDEAQTVAMLSADSGRPASRISKACQIRKEVITCFSPDNVAMFMQFFSRMAENYHSNPKNGVEISEQLYSYVVLGTDKKICTSLLKYLHDN